MTLRSSILGVRAHIESTRTSKLHRKKSTKKTLAHTPLHTLKGSSHMHSVGQDGG